MTPKAGNMTLNIFVNNGTEKKQFICETFQEHKKFSILRNMFLYRFIHFKQAIKKAATNSTFSF